MEKTKPMPPDWLRFIGSTAHLSIYAFLFIAAAQNLRQRSATQRAVLAAQRAQATIAREVLESRLTAMQAQVEPQFLFDSLVDIETLYQPERAAGGAGSRPADHLSARGFAPHARGRFDDRGRDRPGQGVPGRRDFFARRASRASRDAARRLSHCALLSDAVPAAGATRRQATVGRAAGIDQNWHQPRSTTSGDRAAFRPPAGCADDAELARVRERLAGLYGGAASLDCEERDATVQLTMRVPAASGPERD